MRRRRDGVGGGRGGSGRMRRSSWTVSVGGAGRVRCCSVAGHVQKNHHATDVSSVLQVSSTPLHFSIISPQHLAYRASTNMGISLFLAMWGLHAIHCINELSERIDCDTFRFEGLCKDLLGLSLLGIRRQDLSAASSCRREAELRAGEVFDEDMIRSFSTFLDR